MYTIILFKLLKDNVILGSDHFNILNDNTVAAQFSL